MIDLSHICKTYVMGEETIKAMDDVSLHIYPQEYVSVVGPSGSGKSTLMHILGCLDRADAGRYLLEGQDVTLCSPGELSRIRSRRIGFVFQQFYLLPQMTAYENVELPLLYQHVRVRNAGKGSAVRWKRWVWAAAWGTGRISFPGDSSSGRPLPEHWSRNRR